MRSTAPGAGKRSRVLGVDVSVEEDQWPVEPFTASCATRRATDGRPITVWMAEDGCTGAGGRAGGARRSLRAPGSVESVGFLVQVALFDLVAAQFGSSAEEFGGGGAVADLL